MRRLLVLVALPVLWLVSGCEPSDELCPDVYLTCDDDRDCEQVTTPYAKCLDDHDVGRVCARYFLTCPTMLRWNDCAGSNGRRSVWAGRCVRPEFLPDAATGDLATPPDAGADADLSSSSDGPGPS